MYSWIFRVAGKYRRHNYKNPKLVVFLVAFIQNNLAREAAGGSLAGGLMTQPHLVLLFCAGVVTW